MQIFLRGIYLGFFLLFFSFNGAFAQSDYLIKDYKVDMQLQGDGSMYIKEDITVDFAISEHTYDKYLFFYLNNEINKLPFYQKSSMLEKGLIKFFTFLFVVILLIGSFLLFLFPLILPLFRFYLARRNSNWASKERLGWSIKLKKIPYYVPPKDICHLVLFSFWFGDSYKKYSLARINVYLITAIVYYLAQKGFIEIDQYFIKNASKKKLDTSNRIVLRKNIMKAAQWSKIELTVINMLFGASSVFDLKSFSAEEYYIIFSRIERYLESLWKSDLYKDTSFVEKKMFGYKLNEKGREIIQEMYGYKLFLKKVDTPVVEHFLKRDPFFIQKNMHWLLLWGISTKFTKKIIS